MRKIILIAILILMMSCTPSFQEIPVDYKGNFPTGTFRAVIGDEEVFTNGPDIVNVTIYNPPVTVGCFNETEDFFCPFAIVITISDASAEKFAGMTSDLEAEDDYLSKNLTLYFENEKFDELRISSELKGVKKNDIMIHGSGTGKSEREAIKDAEQKHDKLVHTFLDVK